VPEEIPLEEGLMPILGGEGIEGGVDGGVPGGVIGGIVGGLPEAPPPPKRVVRVGGSINPPALLRRVEPVYPSIAEQARIKGIVILEAHVDESGRVRDVRILRGIPLLNEAAVTAVQQWRYKPLLLNGIPTEFLLSVTVQFELSTAPGAKPGN
jgi:protein TonB